MTIEGVDYSFDRPTSPQALHSAGKRFAARYLAIPPNGKIITRAEADGLAKAGLWIVVAWEQSGTGATSPEDAARQVLSQAEALGIPHGRPIYAAADFDVQSGDYGHVKDWITRFHKALGGKYDGRALYGSYYLIKTGLDQGWLKWGWQTYAWSGNNRDPRAQLYQYSNGHVVAGCDVDYDRAYTADYGQWMPGKLPAETEDDMALDHDDVVRIAKAAAQEVWEYESKMNGLKFGDMDRAVYDSVRYGEAGVRTTGDGMAELLDRLGRIELKLDALEK